MRNYMKILNLVKLEESDIKYKISKFPDGQQQLTILNIDGVYGWEEYKFGECLVYTGVQIKTRLNNFLDLELLILAVKSLRGIGIDIINLYVPYFLG